MGHMYIPIAVPGQTERFSLSLSLSPSLSLQLGDLSHPLVNLILSRHTHTRPRPQESGPATLIAPPRHGAPTNLDLHRFNRHTMFERGKVQCSAMCSVSIINCHCDAMVAEMGLRLIRPLPLSLCHSANCFIASSPFECHTARC